ncbi:MAG: GNAT family N-acetyltransferase [Armatimonadetes bacterium]|nr:GNAT family N-acetyltransferase [Armatimonadota bacterium]
MEPRAVQKSEVPQLTEMLGRIFRLDRRYLYEEMAREVGRATSRRNALVLEADGKIVSHIRTAYSHVSIYGCTFKIASIGCVATEDAYRGREYASRVLDASLRQMRRAGAKVLIVSGSRGLYQRAHCVPAGRLCEAVLRPDFGERRATLSVSKVDAREWATLAPLQQAESVRFARELGFLEQRPFWWDCEYPEVWLVAQHGRPVAYLALLPGWPRDSARQKRVTWEYGGSRAAIVEALPSVFEEGGLEEIRLSALGHDLELQYLLAERGVELTETTLHDTHRLIDLPGLIRRLRPYLRERLTRAELRGLCFDQQGERCAISRGDQRVEMSLSQAAPLVLGGPGAPVLTGTLADILGRVLPIPFPTPGYNYL